MKRTRWVRMWAVLAGLLMAGAALAGCEKGDQVVRLHVIANSDSPADQAVNL